MKDLRIMVAEIKGYCPIYEVGDVFHIVDGYKLKTDMFICMHSLSSIIPYYVALSRGISPKSLGLGGDKIAYVQCLDPCDYTNGGTVVFSIYMQEQGMNED